MAKKGPDDNISTYISIVCILEKLSIEFKVSYDKDEYYDGIWLA